MAILKRAIEDTLKRLSKGFPIVGIMGPRQSGKTTLARLLFGDKPYVSLEDPDVFEYANDDPKGFLSQYQKGAIFDECQRVPSLFSYLQRIVDESNKMGLFILTSSQQFGLRSKISQSLAGRIGLVTLLPFTLEEAKLANKSYRLFDQMRTGFYPPLYDRSLLPTDWFASYLQTYVEKDVRQLINIKDLKAFQTFVRMCAGRVGQLVNLSSLGNDCGMSHVTTKDWLSVLEASYLIYTLEPHFRNFSKRLIKSSKVYFHDTGLLCYLLNIKDSQDLNTHPFRGQIFENFIINEYFKSSYNRGELPDFYFWRDNSGTEIDLLYEQKGKIIPVEIKSGQTISKDYFKNILLWQKYAGEEGGEGIVIYGGDEDQKRSNQIVYSWKNYTDYLPATGSI